MLVAFGQVLLGSLFVIGGLRHIPILDALTAMAGARGLPFPKAAVIAATLFEIVAGALLALGLYPALAAFGLIAFTIAASVIGADFWNLEGEQRAAMINVWLSNIAIMGGLLVVAGTTG
jgi:putative oxidoreductase